MKQQQHNTTLIMSFDKLLFFSPSNHNHLLWSSILIIINHHHHVCCAQTASLLTLLWLSFDHRHLYNGYSVFLYFSSSHYLLSFKTCLITTFTVCYNTFPLVLLSAYLALHFNCRLHRPLLRKEMKRNQFLAWCSWSSLALSFLSSPASLFLLWCILPQGFLKCPPLSSPTV